MLYCQESTLSKTQEAEKMGKKTVLIAGQTIPRKKVFIRNKGSGTGVNLVAGNSRIKHNKSG